MIAELSPSAVGVSGSTSSASRSRLLVERTLEHLRRLGARTSLLDLVALPADALLARRQDPAVAAEVAAAGAAAILVVGTPIYRATYTGQLKSFFDLFPRDGLAGSVAGLIATGYGEGHSLAIDHGLRPLVASLGALSAARAIYAVDAEIPDTTVVPAPLDAATAALAGELWRLATLGSPTRGHRSARSFIIADG